MERSIELDSCTSAGAAGVTPSTQVNVLAARAGREDTDVSRGCLEAGKTRADGPVPAGSARSGVRPLTTHLATLRNTARDDPAAPLVNLLRGPYVTLNGRRLEVPEGSKRLLAYVCLHSGPVERRRVAGTLWPDGDEVRAAGNMRSALWRLKGSGIDVVDSDKAQLWLRHGTLVDIDVLCSWAHRLLRGRPLPEDLHLADWHAGSLDLLPGMYDEWALIERECRRQLLLHALESLSRHLVAGGSAGEAVVVASTAVAAEPLRESAQLVLIEAHLAEGNLCEARRSFEVYRDLTVRELGVEPSGRLHSLAYRSTGSSPNPGGSARWS